MPPRKTRVTNAKGTKLLEKKSDKLEEVLKELEEDSEGGISDQRPLNIKQKKFCEYYVSEEFFGSGVEAYLKAYKLLRGYKPHYDIARTNASRLLAKANICQYINSMLESSGLNDQFADKQLLYLMTQHEDRTAKTAALKMYNDLKGRINKTPQITITFNYDQFLSEAIGTRQVKSLDPPVHGQLLGIPEELFENQNQEE